LIKKGCNKKTDFFPADIFFCPACGERRGRHPLVFDGSCNLVCDACGAVYPVIGGVPRFVFTDNSVGDAAQKQVMKSFGDKWSRVPYYGHKGKTAEFAQRWFFQRYNWYKSEDDLRRFLLRRRAILDAGCGLGYLLRWFRSLIIGGNPGSKKSGNMLIGFDISRAVDFANDKNRHGIYLAQADIMNPPFKKMSFDYIISDGVLHHTPDTRTALERLISLLKPGGVIEFYIYLKKNPMREFSDDYIRSYTVKMSERECWDFCKKLTALARQTSALKGKITIDRTIPVIGIEKGVYTPHEFMYYFFMKFFWNKNFTYEENNLVNFDWYHPRYANRHTPSEVISWAKELNMKLENINVIKSGIAARFRKKL